MAPKIENNTHVCLWITIYISFNSWIRTLFRYQKLWQIVGGNWVKNVETSMIHTLEIVKRLKSCRDNFRDYRESVGLLWRVKWGWRRWHSCLPGVQSSGWGAVESLGAAAIQPTHASTLADGDDPLSDEKATDEEGFSGMRMDLAVALAC